MADEFTMRHRVSYYEVDGQGVVFNMWYLGWFDDAMTAFLADRGLDYTSLLEAGFDVMVVRSELDWRGGARWGDEVDIAVAPARFGRTSFALDFQVRRDGEALVDGRTTYVVIAPDGSGTREIPDTLRAALGPEQPIHDR